MAAQAPPRGVASALTSAAYLVSSTVAEAAPAAANAWPGAMASFTPRPSSMAARPQNAAPAAPDDYQNRTRAKRLKRTAEDAARFWPCWELSSVLVISITPLSGLLGWAARSRTMSTGITWRVQSAQAPSCSRRRHRPAPPAVMHHLVVCPVRCWCPIQRGAAVRLTVLLTRRVLIHAVKCSTAGKHRQIQWASPCVGVFVVAVLTLQRYMPQRLCKYSDNRRRAGR